MCMFSKYSVSRYLLSLVVYLTYCCSFVVLPLRVSDYDDQTPQHPEDEKDLEQPVLADSAELIASSSIIIISVSPTSEVMKPAACRKPSLG